MIDFFPVEYYFRIYINFCLILVLLTVIHSHLLDMDDKRNLIYLGLTGSILLLFSIFYIGWRPVSGKYFLDMRTYANHFEYYQDGNPIISQKDVFFHALMMGCSKIMSVNNFFLMCAVVYIVPMFRISKKFFKEYWFYAFLIFVISFQFWPYAVNGIRNGMGTSLFLLGISFYDKKFWMIVPMVFAVLIHQSLLLPVMAFVITLIYNKPKVFLAGWLFTIPVSLAVGSLFETLFTAMGFAEDRLGAYLSGEQAAGGFRFDFLLYSASAVFTGWYFIFKRNFQDKVYYHIFNTYLTVNAFWILIIRANFSNRFAYLSWFMIGLVIIYPFLKERFYIYQHVVIGRVIALYFGFTYFMYTVYY
ncbi:MAG: EpsG family protein [Leeuwenhoekiella sp.]